MTVYEKIIKYVDEHINEEITIDDLISSTGYSRPRLYEIFKEHTDVPIMEYIRRKKLYAAADELRTEKKLYEIALSYGYETPTGFGKAFRNIFGCSPSDYKNKIAETKEQIMRSIARYTKQIELDPNAALSYSYRGYDYALIGEHDKAIEDFNKALEIDAGFVWGYVHRSWSYSQLGEHEKSLEDYNKVLEFEEFIPTFAWSYYVHGCEYAILGQNEKAAECYNKSLELNPDDAEARKRLDEILKLSLK